MPPMSAFEPMTSPAPVATAAEAEGLTSHFLDVMDALVDVVQQETELVRAGHVGQAAQLAAPKADLTRLYIGDTLRLRASHTHLLRILPAKRLEELRQRHNTFRALLQINLTVLATAHAVSEGIVRGVSDELARKATPQTYGASGLTVKPNRSAGQPLTISKVL